MSGLSSPPTNERRSKRKRAAITIGQLSITAGVLLFLLHDPEKRAEFTEVLRHAQRHWLIAGVIVYGLVEVVAAWRWERLLHVQKIFLSRWRLVTLLLIGLFFNFFIPGGTGGDVVKVFYLLKEAPGRGAAAVLSVLIDRIVGLFSLILLAGCFIFFRWDWLTSTPETRSFVFTTLVILGVTGGTVVFASILSGFGLVHRLPKRFPARERLAELALALNQYGRARGAMVRAFLGSVLCHLAYIFVFYCAARSLSQPGRRLPTYLELCSIMPTVNSITALPISLGGLGVREGLFQVFLHKLAGVHGAVAMVISTTGFLITACWGAIGGILYLGYRSTDHARVAQMREDVAAAEHEAAEADLALELGPPAAAAAPCPAKPESVR